MVSSFFERAFDTCGGGLVATCVCGVTHFNSADAQDFEPGELERLEAAAKENPDKYCSKDHSIGTMMIPFAGEVVFGCWCGTAEKAEEILRREGDRIAEYLNRYAEALRERASRVQVGDQEPVLVRKSDEELQRETGQVLRGARRMLDLSMGATARALGIDVPTLSNIERGRQVLYDDYPRQMLTRMISCADARDADKTGDPT